MRVFLDDERATPAGWVRVAWPHEAIALLEKGVVEEISLDHDLGDDERGTGYDVILWVERAVALDGFTPPRIIVHSANSSARSKMVAGIEAITRLAEERKRSTPSLGVKFAPSGEALPFKGSTIICPLSETAGSALYRGLVEIYASRDQYGFSAKTGYLPPSSYHVTIFGCAADKKRTPQRWPSTVALDSSIDACNQYVEERLRSFQCHCDMPMRFRIDGTEHQADRLPLSFGVVPYDKPENRKLQDLRQRLSAHLGLCLDNPGNYRFHVTMGYAIGSLTQDEEGMFLALHARWRAMLAGCSPILELGFPAFCTYEDMLAFEHRCSLS